MDLGFRAGSRVHGVSLLFIFLSFARVGLGLGMYHREPFSVDLWGASTLGIPEGDVPGLS